MQASVFGVVIIYYILEAFDDFLLSRIGRKAQAREKNVKSLNEKR